jgi:putative membrane-bound dehydrogenase-like protein
MFPRCRWPFFIAPLFAVRLLAGEFPEPTDSETAATKPLSPTEAATGWKLPPGFAVTLCAAEPDVRQPIAMTFDPRGRLWVAENFTYADARVKFATNFNDRLLIFEDTDGDGRFDSRKVFTDQVKMLTSVEVGLGGVWLMCPPKVLFVPDRNGDDIPDGPPEVVLDGFGTTTGNNHTFANGLKWGPDGWLWGRVGISSPTSLGRPGDPDSARHVMGGGIWRYHPETKTVEVVAHGTTNPWGLDWNAEGEPFFINTVIGHLWHAIPGARYRRMYGDDPNPKAYTLIEQHADHFHFDTGAGWTKSRAGMGDGVVAPDSDALGGGHAHTGLMIYQGGNWPAEYEGALFTINFHGRRLNRERLVREGSGYVGRHAPDFGFSPDPWFRGIDLIQGPDGAAYISDWSDTGECHDHDGVHRSSGRIYRLAYKDGKAPGPRSISPNASDAELIAFQAGASEWHRRQARNVLRDRAAAGTLEAGTPSALLQSLSAARTRAEKLHALWALAAIDKADGSVLRGLTSDGDEHVRSWAVRLLADSPAREKTDFAALARNESSALVRLYLASALRKLPTEERGALASALLGYSEDDADHNQGAMIWFGIEPMIPQAPAVGAGLAIHGKIQTVRRNIVRLFAEDIAKNSDLLGAILLQAGVSSPVDQLSVLGGISDALRGLRKAPAPSGWADATTKFSQSADTRVRDLARELGLVFGDGRALDDLKKIFADPNASPANRRAALKSLLDVKPEGLPALLTAQANDATVWGPAIAGLINLGRPEGVELAAGKYQWMNGADREAVLSAAVTRASSADALLDFVVAGKIPKNDLTPTLARQIAGISNNDLKTKLASVWGVIGAASKDKRQAIETLRSELAAALPSANLSAGRAQFQRLCAGCHVLYGEGGQVGPDLTGSGRANLDYLLENVVDPATVVAADFRMTVAELKDGRTLNGLLREVNPRTVTIVSQAERLTVERSEIVKLETTDSSMMPEGLLESLKPQERRDLIGYLMHPRQVPAAAGQ